MGLLPPVARVAGGTALFDGVDLLTRTPRQLRKIRGGAIGAVFQDPMSSLDPTLRIGDHIAEPRRLHLGESRRAAWRHARDLLDQVGIPNAAQRLHAYPHELSGGMQQRVVIASAIACECKLLIADEPTTALDVTIQAEILNLLADLQRNLDMAVLLVTHDLGVVAEFCDDVVVMYAGHVVERSGVRDTFRGRQHPYTDALFAAVPRPGRAHSELMTISGRVPPAGQMPAGCRFMPRCVHAEEPCALPQPELEVSAGHTTRCGRVCDGSLRLGDAR
jgi:oligopeptide/dipeptide ABC transporter ATP-binding protein